MANDASTQVVHKHFWKVATVRAVYVAMAFAGCAAGPVRRKLPHQDPAVFATFPDEESLSLWVGTVQPEYHSITTREYATILLECDVGFVLLGRLSKDEPGQHAAGILRALRMSRRLADWQLDSDARVYLVNSMVFRRSGVGLATDLTQFTLCDRSPELYNRRLVDKRAWQLEPSDSDPALLLDLVSSLETLPANESPLDATVALQPAAPRSRAAETRAPPRIDRAADRASDLASPLHWSEDDIVLLRHRAVPALAPTSREQQSLARIGQGLFRKRVAEVETGCRITGLSELEHLRASHVKPWRDSSDAERLDGNNGLLLSPHVDHLFDQGYISFAADATVLFAAALSQAVIERWRLDQPVAIRPFNPRQAAFMVYHRKNVFRGG